MSPRLWVCHRCERIGSDAEAERHVENTGHAVEQLSQDVSDAVRAEQGSGDFDLAAGLLTLLRSPYPLTCTRSHL